MKINIDIPLLKDERKYWHTVEESCLDINNLLVYNKRKKAVDMYLDGFTYLEITKETGINGKGEVRRLLLKCILADEYGNYCGYPALIPYKRVIKSYTRQKEETVFSSNGGNSGMFTYLLNNYPDLKLYIENLYFGKIKSIYEKNMTPAVIHEKFKDKCKAIGIKEYEYPFSVKSQAKRSLYSYLNQLAINNPHKNHNRLTDDAYQKLCSTGVGDKGSAPEIRPFSVVQIDGHKIDCIVTYEITTPKGDKETKTISRFWLLSLIDVATRVILGYHITIETEYDRFDVLKCIKNAIVPKYPMKFKIAGLEYPDNFGYHSLAIPHTEWAVFDEIMLDNAKAHLSKDVIKQITGYLNATVNFGPVATPERRQVIERSYQTIESRLYHRLASTTGTGISDVRRRNAEKDAIKHIITFEEILELTEIIIAQYNNSPHDANNGFTPLEVMNQRLDKGLLPNYIENEKRQNFMLNYITVTRKVNGKIGTGRRPYITFEGAEYRSDVLSKSFSLVGRTLTLRFNPDDIRICKAYFDDGTEFCDLCVVGKWRNQAHSLDQRRDANALLNEKKLKGNNFVDAIKCYEQHLTEKAYNSKPARNKLAALNQTMNSNNEKIFESDTQNESSVLNKNKIELLSSEELEIRFKHKNNQMKFNI